VIAITGATGALGSRVVRLLAGQHRALRLLVRDPARLGPRTDLEVARIESYTDDAGLRAALSGCDTLLLVSGRESADRVREHRTVIEAAVDAGVAKIVYISFQGAAPEATFTFARDHWHTEQLILASGINQVFLRDSFYLSGLVLLAGADGVIRGPADGGRVAGVAHDDVAAVAATVLVDDRWDRTTLDVTGPEALTLSEVAQRLSQVTGRTIRYVEETEEQAYASRAGYGAPAFEVAGWVSSYQAIAAGEVAAVSDTVEQVTGRAPQGLADFLSSEPSSWAHLVKSS
jgi:NAD(P)H dehydrogenase (quinone)